MQQIIQNYKSNRQLSSQVGKCEVKKENTKKTKQKQRARHEWHIGRQHKLMYIIMLKITLYYSILDLNSLLMLCTVEKCQLFTSKFTLVSLFILLKLLMLVMLYMPWEMPLFSPWLVIKLFKITTILCSSMHTWDVQFIYMGEKFIKSFHFISVWY